MHTLRGLLGRLGGRLRREHGFSLMEPLVAVPLLIAVSTAAATFGLQVMKGQAEARNRVTLAENAQRSLDRMVREMRSGSSIQYLAHDVAIPVAQESIYINSLGSGVKSFDNCEPTDPGYGEGYCAGETNRVLAKDVLLSKVGTERRDVLYRCALGWYYVYFPYCYEAFSTEPSGPTLEITDPSSLNNPAALPPGMTCRLIYPVGGISGTSGSAGSTCDFIGAGSLGGVWANSAFAADDWVWPSIGIAVFRFNLNGATPIDDYVELQPVICLRNAYCSQPGYKRPLRLNASVTPRNLSRFQLSEACFNSDPADDPPGGCPS